MFLSNYKYLILIVCLILSVGNAGADSTIPSVSPTAATTALASVELSSTPSKAELSMEPTKSPTATESNAEPTPSPNTDTTAPSPTASESTTMEPVPTPDPTTKSPTESPTSQDLKDKIKEEEEEVVRIVKNRTAEVMAGILVVFGIVGMLVTAWQMLENPNGLCASFCKCSLAVSMFLTKIVCLPCRLICCRRYVGYTGSSPDDSSLFMASRGHTDELGGDGADLEIA